MDKNKRQCVLDISEGLPIDKALDVYDLNKEYAKENAFSKSIKMAERDFLMRQFKAAQLLIDEGDKSASKLVMFFIDGSLKKDVSESLEIKVDYEDGEKITRVELEKMLLDAGIPIKEYDSEQIHTKGSSEVHHSIDPAKKYH